MIVLTSYKKAFLRRKIKMNKLPKMEKVYFVENYNGEAVYITYADTNLEQQTFVAYENLDEATIIKHTKRLAKRFGVEYSEYYGG